MFIIETRVPKRRPARGLHTARLLVIRRLTHTGVTRARELRLRLAFLLAKQGVAPDHRIDEATHDLVFIIETRVPKRRPARGLDTSALLVIRRFTHTRITRARELRLRLAFLLAKQCVAPDHRIDEATHDLVFIIETRVPKRRPARGLDTARLLVIRRFTHTRVSPARELRLRFAFLLAKQGVAPDRRIDEATHDLVFIIETRVPKRRPARGLDTARLLVIRRFTHTRVARARELRFRFAFLLAKQGVAPDHRIDEATHDHVFIVK